MLQELIALVQEGAEGLEVYLHEGIFERSR